MSTGSASNPVLTIQDLIYGVMEFYHKKAISEGLGVALFPGSYVVTWHRFFYTLKSYSEELPVLNEIVGHFDWDGEFPRSPEVQEALDSTLRNCVPIPHTNHMMLWVRRQSNPFLQRQFPRLHETVMDQARKQEGLITYHRLPFPD